MLYVNYISEKAVKKNEQINRNKLKIEANKNSTLKKLLLIRDWPN